MQLTEQKKSAFPSRPSPRASTPAILPIFAELTPRPDGTFLLKPRVVDSDIDTWISPSRAAAIIGIQGRSIYRLINPEHPYLVHKRPLKGCCRISLMSVHAYVKATNDPDFWETPVLQENLKKEVQKKMNTLRGMPNAGE